MLSQITIPLPSASIITRSESQGMLLFQVYTDEMHFITKDAFALFQLCDGSRTVAQIEDLLAENDPQFATIEGRQMVENFLEALADREIVELWR